MSILSSATRLCDAAASAWICIFSASATAKTRTASVRFRRFAHLGEQILLAQLSGTLGQFGAHRQHLALSLGFGSGAGLGSLGLGVIDLGHVLSLYDGGLMPEFGLFERWLLLRFGSGLG